MVAATPLRRALGHCFLATTVFLWTASSFLASSIFADATYSKPYFVTYFNTSFFTLPLVPFFAWKLYCNEIRGARTSQYARLGDADDGESPRPSDISSAARDSSPQARDGDERRAGDAFDAARINDAPLPPMTVRETFNLSAKFSLLWFTSNYFNSASLQYTSVASCTILSCTSGVFTLIFGAIFGIEKFNYKKLLGVLGSLAGIAIIATADTVVDDADRGTFPYKSPGEIAIGDAMALFTAVLYGIYIVHFGQTVGDESRVRMPLFFGFIGIVNVLFLWPGLAILHWTGIEKFQLPPTNHVWAIVVINAGASLIADICWAYGTLLLSPLVVTVGLSLSMPLSLLGQVVLNSHWASPLYFVGAFIVLLSFIFINYESSTALPPPPAEQARTD